MGVSYIKKLCIFLGTMAYLPPERFDPSEYHVYDVRSDIWSLGITLLECAVNGHPILLNEQVKSKAVATNFFTLTRYLLNIKTETFVEDVLGNNYSLKTRNFLKSCLTRIEDRKRYEELKETPFYNYYSQKSTTIVKSYMIKVWILFNFNLFI